MHLSWNLLGQTAAFVDAVFVVRKNPNYNKKKLKTSVEAKKGGKTLGGSSRWAHHQGQQLSTFAVQKSHNISTLFDTIFLTI